MTDPIPPTPLDNASGSEPAEQPNPIARSALGIMRRTERALSPWSRRFLQAASAPASTVQRSPDQAASSERASRSPVVAARNPTVSGKTALTLARRAQSAEMPAVVQRSPEPRTVTLSERFAATVVRRFPEVAAKYEAKPVEAPETIQRSPLPFVGSDSPAPESSMGGLTMPALDLPSDENETPFYPSVSTQESVASQLADRLQTYRDQPSAAPSPREMSRITAERAAARTKPAASNQPVIRRSRVEEIGNKSTPAGEELPPTPPKPAAPRETVQRKPAEGPAPELQTVSPKAEAAPKPVATPPAGPSPAATRKPTIQRKPAAPVSDQSSSDAEANLGPRPGLPSLSHQLLQRFQAGRDEWDAEAAEPNSELPTFLRPAATPQLAKPASVQRKPQSGEPPSAPSQPPEIEHRESRPVRRATQPKPAPVVQRKPKSELPEPGDDLALQQQPVAPAPVPSAPAPTIQRSPEEPEIQAADELPGATQPSAPRPVASVSAPNDLPLAQPAAKAQRKPSVEPGLDSAVPVAPTESPVTHSASPVIQRAPELQPVPAESPRPPALTAGPELKSPEASASELSQSSLPASLPKAEGPSIQRSAAELPLHVPPTPQPALPATEPTETAEPGASITTQPPARASLPLSTPPSVQRVPELPVSLPEAPQPEASFDAPLPVAQTPAPTVSVQRKLTPEARQANMPLAAPRGEVPMPASFTTIIQRTPDDTAPLPEALPLVAIRDPKPVPQAAKPMAVVQRQVDSATTTLDVPRPILPLARVAPSVAGNIQREISTTTSSPGTDTSSGSVSESSTGAGKKSTVDLNDLARKIYPILKRMLAIEKERR